MISNNKISDALGAGVSPAFWERLRELGLSEVRIHYEASYGGGEITEITGVDQKGGDVLRSEFDALVGPALVQYLTHLGCELLQRRIPSWTEGDGCMGALVLFVAAKRMQFWHATRAFAILDV